MSAELKRDASWKTQGGEGPVGSNGAEMPTGREGQGKGFRDAGVDPALPFADSEARAI